MTLIKCQPLSEPWHALRDKSIGASEVAALFGLSPFLTKFELWARKSGKVVNKTADNPRMFWGRKLERVIAEGIAEQEGWTLSEPEGFYTNDNCKGMGATPDFFVSMPSREGLGCLEIKNIDYQQFRRDWQPEPPFQYLLQLQAQLACTGYKWGVLGAFVGGNSFELYPYDRHEPTIAKIEQAVRDFWHSVAEGKEPSLEGDDYDIVKDLHKIKPDTLADLTGDNQLPELCAGLLKAKEELKKAEAEEKRLKAEIINKLGDSEQAKAQGFFIKYNQITKNIAAKEAYTQQYRILNVKEMTI